MTEAQQVQDIHSLISSGTVAKPVELIDNDALLGLALDETPLMVTAVQMGTNDEYGFKWQIQAVIQDQPVAFSLRNNLARDGFLEALAAATIAGPIAGLKLSTQVAGAFKRVVIVPI